MDRTEISFAQAEGVERLPTQLALRAVSTEMTALLWAVFSDHFDSAVVRPRMYGETFSLNNPWRSILKRWWIARLHKDADKFPAVEDIKNIVRTKIRSDNYVDVFDFLQFIVRCEECPAKFHESVSLILETTRAAYRLVDRTVLPLSSREEAEAIASALVSIDKSGRDGPRSHLRLARDALSAGDWPSAMRESIHSVEGAARSIEPEAKTLGPALDKLQKSIGLNLALKKAFSSLYGFTSDEQGIRHSLVFGAEAKVSERDAIFMFGACASFVAYLLTAERRIAETDITLK